METQELEVKSDFSTKEIGLVAYLSLNNIKPANTEITKLSHGNKRIAQFWFYKTSDTNDLRDKYFNNEAQVEPIAFQSAIRNIKTRINNYDG